MRKEVKEEWAIVLDFLPHGDPTRGITKPLVQAIGKDYFILLELLPKRGVEIKPEEEVYIGPGKRDKIHAVLGKIKYEQLTPFAKEILPKVIERIVTEKEQKFVEFFNKAGPITPKLHALELLPNIGKKTLWEILEEREKEPFKSFEDMKKRIKGLPDPKKCIVQRILDELQGKDKYCLFVVR